MKKLNLWSLMALMAVVAVFTSCSKGSDHVKFMPSDAVAIARIDAKQIVEKSGLDQQGQQKDLKKVLKDVNMSNSFRHRVEEIFSDPTKLGLDLRQPVFAGASYDKHDGKVGVSAVVYDRKNIESFLNGMMREAGADGRIRQKNGYSYYASTPDELLIVFNDDYFYLTNIGPMDNEDDALEDAIALFDGDDEAIMGEQGVSDLCSASGICQVLFRPGGLSADPEFARALREVPDNLNIDNIALLFDLSVDNGTAQLDYQLITDDADWNTYLEESGKAFGKITDANVPYVSDKGFAVLANVNGEAFYDKLMEDEALKSRIERSPEQKKMFRDCLSSLNGDVAFDLSDVEPNYPSYPTLTLVAQTKDKSIQQTVNQLAASDRNVELNANGGREPIAYDRGDDFWNDNPTPVAYVDWGAKGNSTYFVTGKKPKGLKSVSKPIDASGAVGTAFYARLNFDLIGNILKAKKYQDSETKMAIDVIKAFKYAEMTIRDAKNGTIKLVMKDDSVTPLQTLVKSLLKIALNPGAYAGSAPEEPAWNQYESVPNIDEVDSAMVDSTPIITDVEEYDTVY